MNLIKENIYKVADVITLGRGVQKTISDFTLRLPLRYHSYFPPNYENENFAFLKKYCREDSVVLDIGAHIGLFAVCASQLAGKGKVYAFEPTPATFGLLRKTVALNKKEQLVEASGEAVAEKDGSTFFYVSDEEGDNSNSLVGYRNDKKLKKIPIKITSIDNFLQRRGISKIGFIKIDAEGYECKVLRGAAATFKSSRLYGILALHPAGIAGNGDSLESIYDFLMEHNYKIYFDGRTISRDEFCEKESLFDVQLIPG